LNKYLSVRTSASSKRLTESRGIAEAYVCVAKSELAPENWLINVNEICSFHVDKIREMNIYSLIGNVTYPNTTINET
jgi:hypothetical protein